MRSVPLLFSCAVLLCPAAVHAEAEFQWELRRIGDRRYLSAIQIGRFYDLNLSRREGNKVVLEDGKRVSLELEIGSPVCRMNGLKFVLEAPVTEADSAVQILSSDLHGIIDPVLRPAMIQNRGLLKTVILDPALEGDGVDLALLIAKQAAEELTRAGCKVVLTRDDPTGVTPEACLGLANAVEGNAVFVRIHFGGAKDGTRGFRTTPLFLPMDAPPAAGSPAPAGMALAAAVHGSLASMLGQYMVDLGIQRASDPVLSKLQHPAILIDVGSLVDPEDGKRLQNEAYRKTLAKAIGSGIRKYKNATKQ